MSKKILYLYILLFISTQKIICVKSVNVIKPVSAKALDKATGNFYIGLIQDLIGGTSSPNAIMVLPRYNGYGNPTSSTVVQNGGAGIELLTISTQQCSTKPLLIATQPSASGPQMQTQVLGYSSGFATNNKSATSDNINDATASVTSGIIALAASEKYVYAAVKPNASSSLFGQAGSGLAAITITNNTNIGGSLLLTQTNAQTALNNTKISKPINTSISQLTIVTNPTITDPAPYAALEWDEHLQRLYIGISQITANNSANSGTRSIIIANSQADGVVNFANIAPDAAFAAGNQYSIVGAVTSNTDYLTIGVKKLKIMHTSTGKSYLIINGGNAPGVTSPTANITPGNTIYALPLVNNPGASPLPNSIQGTLANYADPTFTTAATNSTEILTSQDTQALVGSASVPLLATQTISDMVVVGDTVYISSSQTQDTNTEPGVFYSQAMFDQYGRIYRWTPWTKKIFPSNNPTGSQIAFIDIDAANGKIWAVGATNGNSSSTVFTTNWDANSSSKNPTDMLGILNKDFKCGCFCHLDLDQSTMGLAEQSPARYALFGGFEQVAFLRISTSLSQIAPYDYNYAFNPKTPYAQSAIQDFSLPENYFLTALPKGAGCINVLEYSRSTFGTQGYFFAGTQSGLYVFADENNGQGFAINQNVNDLDAAPFTNGAWQKVLIIPEAVIDMVSSGNALYVLTFKTSKQNPIINTLYKIDFENTVDAMFAPNLTIIAENATNTPGSDLSNAKMFYSIAVTTAISGNNYFEQILLATNNGIYRSNSFSGSGISSANSQTDAAWEQVDPNDSSTYTNIFTSDNTDILHNGNPITAFETVWPIQLANANNCKTYEKNNITQLSGSISENNPTFDPENFNADIFDCTGSCPQGSCQQNSYSSSNFCNNCSGTNSINNNLINNCSTNYINSVNSKFDNLDQIKYFWSDGARRFFVIKRTSETKNLNKLFVIPYDIQQWMVIDPKTQVINDKAIQDINNFYWLGPIGVSGITLAGTNAGFVSLE